nr:hypothetical protein [Pseudomonas sp.]
MNFLSNLLRNVLVLMLALAGLAMAFVLMVSTAIALGVMYVVARVRGKPFAPAVFWQARRNGMQWGFSRPGAAPRQSGGHDASAQQQPAANPQPLGQRYRDLGVTDVEARDIS